MIARMLHVSLTASQLQPVNPTEWHKIKTSPAKKLLDLYRQWTLSKQQFHRIP